MSFVDSIKKDFSLIAILLIPIAVAINFVGGSLALALKLPVYLDSIGTFLVAMLAGPWVGGLTGALSLLVVSATDPTSLPWTILAALMGVVVGYLARFKMFNGILRIAISIIIVIFGSVVMVILIRVIVFGGYSSHVSSVIAGSLLTAGFPFYVAQFISSFFLELPDKILSIIVPLLVIASMSDRYLLKFSNGKIFVDYRKKKKAKTQLKDDK